MSFLIPVYLFSGVIYLVIEFIVSSQNLWFLFMQIHEEYCRSNVLLWKVVLFVFSSLFPHIALLFHLCPTGSQERACRYHSLEHCILEAGAEFNLPQFDCHTDGLLSWWQVFTSCFQRSNLVTVEEAGHNPTRVR